MDTHNNGSNELKMLSSLKTLGISITDSVTWLCRLKHIDFGLNDRIVIQSLSDNKRPVDSAICDDVIERLGVDPWSVYGID